MDMEKSLSVPLLSFGVVLFLLGLLGSIKFKDYELGTQSRTVRAVVALLGATFIIIALAPTDMLRLLPGKSQAAAWAGSWQHTFVGASGKIFEGPMVLRAVDDERVEGDFDSQFGQLRYTGKLEGKISIAQRLEGSWSNGRGQGGLFVLRLTSDGKSFQGTYSMRSEPPDLRPGNTWSGTKSIQ